MSYILIKNSRVVNEGNVFSADILIKNDLIFKISNKIKPQKNYKIVEANNKILIPGVIDDQVHFREPG